MRFKQFLALEDKQEFTDEEQWMDAVKKAHPEVANKLKFKGRVEQGKHTTSAEVSGEDRSYGVFDHDTGKGVVLEATGDSKFDSMLKNITNKSHGTDAEIGWFVVHDKYPCFGPFKFKDTAERKIKDQEDIDDPLAYDYVVKYGEDNEGVFDELPPPSNTRKMIDPSTGKTVDVDLNKATRLSGKAERSFFVGALAAELEEIGIHFSEKPDGWDFLEDHKVITPSKMHKLEVKLAELQHKLLKVDGDKLYGGRKPKSPLASYANKSILPDDSVFILQFKSDGSEYLVNTIGASSYLRMWAKIDV